MIFRFVVILSSFLVFISNVSYSNSDETPEMPLIHIGLRPDERSTKAIYSFDKEGFDKIETILKEWAHQDKGVEAVVRWKHEIVVLGKKAWSGLPTNVIDQIQVAMPETVIVSDIYRGHHLAFLPAPGEAFYKYYLQQDFQNNWHISKGLVGDGAPKNLQFSFSLVSDGEPFETKRLSDAFSSWQRCAGLMDSQLVFRIDLIGNKTTVHFLLDNEKNAIQNFTRGFLRFFYSAWKFSSNQKLDGSWQWNEFNPEFKINSNISADDNGSQLIFNGGTSRRARVLSERLNHPLFVKFFSATTMGRDFFNRLASLISINQPIKSAEDFTTVKKLVIDDYEKSAWPQRRYGSFRMFEEEILKLAVYTEKLFPILKIEEALGGIIPTRLESIADFWMWIDAYHQDLRGPSQERYTAVSHADDNVAFDLWALSDAVKDSKDWIGALEASLLDFARVHENGVQKISVSPNHFQIIVRTKYAHRLVEFLEYQKIKSSKAKEILIAEKVFWHVSFGNAIPVHPWERLLLDFFDRDDFDGYVLKDEFLGRGALSMSFHSPRFNYRNQVNSFNQKDPSDERSLRAKAMDKMRHKSEAFEEVFLRYKEYFVVSKMDHSYKGLSMYHRSLKADPEALAIFLRQMLTELPGWDISVIRQDDLEAPMFIPETPKEVVDEVIKQWREKNEERLKAALESAEKRGGKMRLPADIIPVKTIFEIVTQPIGSATSVLESCVRLLRE